MRRNVQGAQAQGGVVDVADQHQLVGKSGVCHRQQALFNGVRPADHGFTQKVLDGGPRIGRALLQELRLGRRQGPALPGQDAQHPLVNAAGEQLGLFVRFRRDQRHPHHHMWFGQ